MKRKPIEAWAIRFSDGSTGVANSQTQAHALAAGYPGSRVVRLVETDPRERAVIRAALKWAETIDRRSVEIMIDVDGPLYDAVERLRAKR